MTDTDLARRVRDCCQLAGSFVLRSGRTADDYFDKYQFEAGTARLAEGAAALADVEIRLHALITREVLETA